MKFKQEKKPPGKPKSNSDKYKNIISGLLRFVKEGVMEKEDLKKYLALVREVDDIRKRILQLEENMYTVKAVGMDGMPKGNCVNDSIGNIVARVNDLRSEYLKQYDLALCELYKIERAIEKLEDLTERQLMRKRYIEGKKWEDICVELNYSWRQIHNIHSKILKKIK